MRVLYDHQIFSMQAYGGISRYFFELMNEFEKTNKIQFNLALKRTSNQYVFNLKSMKDLWKSKSTRELLSFLPYNFAFRKSDDLTNQEYSIISLKKQDFDVFHPTYYNPFFLEYLSDKPYVLTVHDMIYEIFPEYFPISDATICQKKNLIERATEIICVSENTKGDLLRIYPDTDTSKVRVIYHGASFYHDLNGESVLEQNAIPSERKHLLFVGSRWLYKNFYFFIVSCVSILKKYPYMDIVCAGGGEFSQDELTFFEHLGIKHRIYYHNADDKHLALLYRNAVAFIFPSLYEGFGLPILEAFACGCPVICSDTSSLPEIAKDAAVYFHPKDIVSIRNAIEKVIHDEEMRDEMVKKGSVYVREFSWVCCAEQTRQVYEKAVSR